MFGQRRPPSLVARLVSSKLVFLAAIGAAAFIMLQAEPDKLALIQQGRGVVDSAQYCSNAIEPDQCQAAFQKVRLFAETIAAELPDGEFARCRRTSDADANALWSCLSDRQGVAISDSYRRPF